LELPHHRDNCMPPRGTYFCIDIEANGPVPGLYDMVSLGAVVVAPSGDGRLRTGRDFYMELKPVAPRFDARAAAIHGLDQDRLKREGLPRKEACLRLASWVKENTVKGSKPVFVGHNAPFDWSYVAWIYAAEELPNPFGYKAICTKSLGMGVMGLNWMDSSKDTFQMMLNLPAEDKDQKHRADYDAHYQAKILIGLLNRIEASP
jgi:DNA polymerase III epsilon subunit-like protein